MRSSATVLATGIAAVAVLAMGATPPARADADAGWRATVTAGAVVTTMESGAFALSADRRAITVRAGDGQEMASLPLGFEFNGRSYPIAADISADSRELTLTPDPAVRHDLAPIASPTENQLALDDLASAMTTNTLIGTVGGTVIGLLVGAVIGFGSCLVVGPGCLATAPAALVAFAGAGGLVGTLLAGGGTLAAGLWRYLATVQAAPGQSEYAQRGGLLDPNGAGVPDANLRFPKITLPSGSS
ncbi:hypothetical protein [Nocardia sp. NPDC020380]|uniref:hypothetical protein n=1 Tax=Nocardia sp. NPDC020380 TaxID=3364309 RepID=UPI0037BA8738